jgi:cytidine deaminase
MRTFELSAAPHGANAPILARAALEVRERAYAPYSKYQVGAAILTASGNLYAGCNVEAADYDGTHAEESALASMVSHGDRSPVMLAVVGALEGQEASLALTPCGKCRQKLMEFASLSGYDLDVVVLAEEGGLRLAKLSELLPSAFGPANIGVDLLKYRR